MKRAGGSRSSTSRLAARFPAPRKSKLLARPFPESGNLLLNLLEAGERFVGKLLVLLALVPVPAIVVRCSSVSYSDSGLVHRSGPPLYSSGAVPVVPLISAA